MFEKIFMDNDPTAFMQVFQPHINKKYTNPSSKSMTVLIIESYLKYVAEIRQQKLSDLHLRSIKDLKTRLNKEKNVEYKRKRIGALQMQEVERIVMKSKTFWLENVRTELLNNKDDNLQYDRTDVYGASMINLCYTNGTRTSDLINLQVEELFSAESVNNYFVIKITKQAALTVID